MTNRSRTSGLNFDSFFAGTPLAMAVLDSRGMILEVNPALENLLAFPAAELCDQNISRFLLSSENDQFLPELLAVPQGEYAKREMECVGSDMRPLPVLVSAQRQKRG